jgi:peptidyl-prolyl cis-trans isomerase B (cyclophilin B)
VSSVRDSRQRAAARARLEREMAARAEAARRKRLRQAQLGAVFGGVVVVLAVVWIVVAVSGDDSRPTANPSAGPAACTWVPAAEQGAPPPEGLQDVGTPPTEPPQQGFQVVTFNTNQGKITMEMDLSKTPCTAASMAHLIGRKFYDGTSCHRLVPSIFALQCGDPTGTGSGGATYKYADENLPLGKTPPYRGGDVAMANGGPGTNGTQFFFIWDDAPGLQPNYTLFGKILSGLNLIRKVGAGGDDGAFEQEAGGGHPKVKMELKTVTIGPVTRESRVKPTSPAPATPTPTPTATASAAP